MNAPDSTLNPSAMADLAEFRAQIDQIDAQLHALFLARLEVVAQVAACKLAQDLPLTHPEREEQLLRAYEAVTPPELQCYVTDFFAHLLEISKEYQKTLLSAQETPHSEGDSCSDE